MKYICSTCNLAGREVAVNSATPPTQAQVHKAHKGFGLGLGNHGPADMVARPDTSTLDGWIEAFVPAESVVLDMDVTKDAATPDARPHIILRDGNSVTLLTVMKLDDHFCVDVHTFVDGKRARTGVFGMENGRRFMFDKGEVQGTSHKWPASHLVTLLVGKQAEADE